MSSIKEHFQTFPEPFRTQALANLNNGMASTSTDENRDVSGPRAALSLGFDWDLAYEENGYWDAFWQTLPKGRMPASETNFKSQNLSTT